MGPGLAIVWNARNLDVPNELLDEENPSGFHLAVFSFGYLQYDLASRNVPPGVECSVSVTELLELFQAWQLKLALAEVHRRTQLRVRPLSLFAFSSDDKVETWIDPTEHIGPEGAE